MSYNAAGVISHIASDGQGAWHCEQVERIDVLRKMVSSIERWNLRSERNINYHSFEPILKLTRIRHTPECQHWAIWALANLTSVYRKCHVFVFFSLASILKLIVGKVQYFERSFLYLWFTTVCKKLPRGQKPSEGTSGGTLRKFLTNFVTGNTFLN